MAASERSREVRSRARTTLAAVCVAALVATAGCSGILAGDRTTRRETYGVAPTATPTTTPVHATPTPSPTPTRTETPQVSLPTNPGVADHPRALLDAKNYTMRVWSNRTTGESSSRTRLTFRIDLTTDHYYLRTVDPGTNASRTVYQTASSAYYRFVRDGAVSYDRDSSMSPTRPRSPLNLSLQVGGYSLVERLGRYDFRRAGGAEFDGEILRKYVASGTGNVPGPGNVTAFEMTVLVDHRGIVRAMEYTKRGTVEGERYVYRYRLTITDLGTTSVGAPEWIGNTTGE